MKTRISIQSLTAFCLFISLFCLFSACKENTILPKNLVPNVDNINTFDTSYELITHTLYQDSLLTGGLRGSTRLSSASTYITPIGVITNDPAFGKTVASTHIEVLPAVPNFTFKSAVANVLIDSIVLSLPFKMAYGDTNATAINQTFKVFRSLKKFSRDSTQYEFTKDSVDHGQVMASLNVNFDRISTDSAFVKDRYQAPQLRFKLASWFADSLKAEITKGTTGALSSFGNFLDWWHGFSIEPDSNSGNTIGYFDSYQTRMNIYYRYPKTGGGEDTAIDVFSFDPNYCNRFSSISHNYLSSTANNFINTKSLLGDSILFVQNEPGLCGIIQIPGVHNLPNVIVNKAELVFTSLSTQNWNDTNTFSVIPRLQIFTCDSLGDDDKVAPDYAAFSSSSYIDGKRANFNVAGINYVQYKFNINYSLQKLISSKDSSIRFKIMGANLGIPAAYRTILAGSGSKINLFKPRLNLIYTKIAK